MFLRRQFFRVWHFCIYVAYRGLAAIAGLLPLELGFRIGQGLGEAAYWTLSGPRSIAIRNLEMAFEGEKSHDEIRSIARSHFRLLGANLVASIKLASMPSARISPRVDLQIPDGITKRRATMHTGWIAMISHIGNWELFAQLRHFLPEYETGAIYHPVRNTFISGHLQKLRARHGVTLFDRRSNLLSAAKYLRNGGAVGVLVDQYAGDLGVWAPLFGRLTSTSPLAAALALHATVPIVPIAIYTIGIARWRIVVSPLLEPSRDDDANSFTAEINLALETQIRKSPKDWLWSHNRWKTPAGHFLFGHLQRGVHLPRGCHPELKPFRILIVAPKSLEECRLSLPAVRAIKQGRPDTEVTLLTQKEMESFWHSVQEIDQLISTTPNESIRSVIKTISMRRNFDVAFLFSQDFRDALVVYAAGIPRRVGYSSWLINQSPSQPPSAHENRYLYLARLVGCRIHE